MSTRKVSLTLPEELVIHAENAVARGQARSVSAYIAAMAGSGRARTTIAETLNKWRAENGEGTPQQRAEAEQRVRAMFDRADARLHARDAA